MATSKATPDRDSIVAEIHIAAPPERVFHALVDPQQVLRWWGRQGVYRSTEFQSDLRRGGTWRTVGVNADGRNFAASGEYLEIDRPRLLFYSWVAQLDGGGENYGPLGAASGQARYAREAPSLRPRCLSRTGQEL